MANRITGVTKTVESKFGKYADLTPNQRRAIEKGWPVQIDRATPDSAGGLAAGSTAGGVASGGHDPESTLLSDDE